MTSGDTKASGLRPTRRTVVKGAAWAVPAVMVASAAPAFAQSGPVIVVPGDPEEGQWCRHTQGQPSTNGVHLTFCFTNNTEEDVQFTFDALVLNGVPASMCVIPASLTVGAGDSTCVSVHGMGINPIGNGVATLTYSYDYFNGTEWVSVPGATVNTPSINDLNPCHSHYGIQQPDCP